jgi:hypothetical protein
MCNHSNQIMQTKSSTVREHITANRWQNAIRIVARFPRLGEHRSAILDAHGAYTNPRFFSQLGKDLEALKQNGISALLAMFPVSK